MSDDKLGSGEIAIYKKNNIDHTNLGPILLLPKWSWHICIQSIQICFFVFCFFSPLSLPKYKAKVEQGPWTKVDILSVYNTINNRHLCVGIAETLVGHPVPTLRWLSQVSSSSTVLQRKTFFLTCLFFIFLNFVFKFTVNQPYRHCKRRVSKVTVKCLGMLELRNWKQNYWIAWQLLK